VINTKQVILLRFVEPASHTTFCLWQTTQQLPAKMLEIT
jgi:hypothetical protein